MTIANSLGKLVIISGPSGAGKSTVVQRLLLNCPLPLALSVSATTRPPRAGEVHGKDYWFLSPEEFASRKERGDFLESKEVFGRGFWYGTLSETVSAGLNSGKWVILEIDVQGAATVLELHPDAITIFLHPGSLQELEQRLRRRGTESEANIARRLEVASEEVAMMHRYRHEVVNREIDQAVAELCALLQKYDV
ncbi:MAG: guanylate kinase [Planctomycetota bacterium]|jgi:guanylate kinase